MRTTRRARVEQSGPKRRQSFPVISSRLIQSVGFACLACWVLVATATATPAEPDGSPRAERVDALLLDVMEIARLPSLSLAILEPDPASGELVIAHQRALGFADVEAKKLATPDTRYRAASVSKIITATALGRLVAAGKIAWDTELGALHIEFPQPEGITPRRLAGHLAGIGHYQGQDKIDRQKQYQSAVEALATFRNSPRAGAPGAQYKYSTHGLTLLSAMLEAVADRPFPEIVASAVTEPLGMTSTGPAPAGQGKDAMATLYMLLRTGAKALPRPENPSYKWAGGGLATTPTDLLRLARAYLQDPQEAPGFLPKEIIETMWTPQHVGGTASGTSTGVGIAWRVGQESSGGRKIVHHAGSMQGARSVLMLFPEERRAIAMMTNSNWDSDVERTASLLMDAWRGPSSQEESAKREAKAVEIPVGRLSYSVQLVALESGGSSGKGGNSEAEAVETFEAVHGKIRVAKKANKITELKAPPGFRKVSRSPVPELRVVQIAGEVWGLVTPRGLARGTCSSPGGSGLACRFQVARRYEVLVELVEEDG